MALLLPLWLYPPPATDWWDASIILSSDPNRLVNCVGFPEVVVADACDDCPQERSGGNRSSRHCGQTCCWSSHVLMHCAIGSI